MKKKSFYKKIIAISNKLEEKYLSKIRTKKSDFTRTRKITIKDLFLQMFLIKENLKKMNYMIFMGR